MRSAALLAGALTLLLGASAASAQANPKLAGKWQLDGAKTKAAGVPPGTNPPAAFTLALTDNAFTRTIESANGSQVLSAKFDGTEARLPYPEPKGTVTAKWNGPTLVLSIARIQPSGPEKSTVEYALDGEALVVATTVTPATGGNASTIKVYYKRAS